MKTLKKHAGLLWVPALILGVLVACSGSSGGGDCLPNDPAPACNPGPNHPDLIVNLPTEGMAVEKGEGILCDMETDPPTTGGYTSRIHIDEPSPALIVCAWTTIKGERIRILKYGVAKTIVDPTLGQHVVIVQLFLSTETEGKPLEEEKRNITVVPAED